MASKKRKSRKSQKLDDLLSLAQSALPHDEAHDAKMAAYEAQLWRSFDLSEVSVGDWVLFTLSPTCSRPVPPCLRQARLGGIVVANDTPSGGLRIKFAVQDPEFELWRFGEVSLSRIDLDYFCVAMKNGSEQWLPVWNWHATHGGGGTYHEITERFQSVTGHIRYYDPFSS